MVDWLRQCYEADFVINETTGETIRGRYYWAAPGAETYPDAHVFGSAVWRDPVERVASGLLGDQFANVTRDDGSPPPVRPLSRRLALRRHLGCSPPNDKVLAMTSDTFQGIPRYCYRQPLNECTLYEQFLDVAEKDTWCFVNHCLSQLYEGFGGIDSYVMAQVPGCIETQSNLIAENGVPQWVMWRATCGRGLIVAGSPNFQTVAMQGLYSWGGPRPLGRFYSNPFWWSRAETLRILFDAFAGRHVSRTFLGGHSFGAAVVGLIGAGETTQATIDQYTTVALGAPRLGNGQVYQHLSPTRSIWLQNEGDPVPSLPPNYPTLSSLLSILGFDTYATWQQWAAPPVSTVVRPDGTTYESRDWNAPLITPETIAEIVADRTIFPLYLNHTQGIYQLRICGS